MRWLKQLVSRRRRYDDLSASIREHLDERIEELMDDGVPRDEAELAAKREFGNVTLTEEHSREVWPKKMPTSPHSIHDIIPASALDGRLPSTRSRLFERNRNHWLRQCLKAPLFRTA